MRDATRWAVAVLLIGLGGCASSPRLAIESVGDWPVSGKPTFGFGPFETGSDNALRASVARCLTRKGMVPSSSPAYLVQTGLSDHSPGSDLLPADESTRRASHRAINRWSRSLTVSIADIASGHDAYRIRVTGQSSHPADRQQQSALVDAACNAIGAAAVAQPSLRFRPLRSLGVRS